MNYNLDESGLIIRIKNLDEIKQLRSGQFIELHAILKKPSLIDAIEGIKRLMEIALLFNKEKEAIKSTNGKNKDSKASANQDVLLQQIDAMLKALTQSVSL